MFSTYILIFIYKYIIYILKTTVKGGLSSLPATVRSIKLRVTPKATTTKQGPKRGSAGELITH